MRPTRRTKQLKRLGLLSVLVLLAASPCRADKFDVMAGFYDLTATASNGRSGNSQNAGVYQFQYRRAIFSQVEVGLGYTLLMSNGIGGSLGYGLDVGAYYFPFTTADATTVDLKDVHLSVNDLWRPYVGGTFNQRQFAGGFAGFGLSFGVEHNLNPLLSFKGEARYLHLSGSDSMSLNDLDVLVGVTFSFQSFK